MGHTLPGRQALGLMGRQRQEVVQSVGEGVPRTLNGRLRRRARRGLDEDPVPQLLLLDKQHSPLVAPTIRIKHARLHKTQTPTSHG